MQLQKRIDSFALLGNSIKQKIETQDAGLLSACSLAEAKNPWFSQSNILKALEGICIFLTKEDLEKWAGNYPNLFPPKAAKTIATILAGNIPFVGFHDVLCVLISGNRIKLKCSSKDEVLPKYIISLLTEIEPEWKDYISFTDGIIKGFDAAIATGSDSSSKYFDLYFGKYPSIIRRNRNSVAVLDGSESKEDIQNLGVDIFSYFGHGCRNVSKIYVPQGYDFNTFFPELESYKDVYNHHKYANNYDYYKAIFLMGQNQFFDNGFMLLKESPELGSPISVVLYEYYNDIDQLVLNLEEKADTLQCIVSNKPIFHTPNTAFGKTQSPELTDYADNIDTMAFLQNL